MFILYVDPSAMGYGAAYNPEGEGVEEGLQQYQQSYMQQLQQQRTQAEMNQIAQQQMQGMSTPQQMDAIAQQQLQQQQEQQLQLMQPAMDALAQQQIQQAQQQQAQQQLYMNMVRRAANGSDPEVDNFLSNFTIEQRTQFNVSVDLYRQEQLVEQDDAKRRREANQSLTDILRQY